MCNYCTRTGNGKVRIRGRMGRYGRQQLSHWSRGHHDSCTNEKTGLEIEHIKKSSSTKAVPVCRAPNRLKARDYWCSVCGITCHRGAAESIRILHKSRYWECFLVDSGGNVRVTKLWAVEGLSCDRERKVHPKVQRRKARALSGPQDSPSTWEIEMGESRGEFSSSSSSGRASLTVVA